MSQQEPSKPLSHQTGFWRNIEERGRLGKTDVLRLRDDLKRLEEQVRQIGAGGTRCSDITSEVQRIRNTIATDYATQSLIQQTIIELLIEKGVITDDEFADKLDEIDMRDGVQDGMLHGDSAVPASPTKE